MYLLYSLYEIKDYWRKGQNPGPNSTSAALAYCFALPDTAQSCLGDLYSTLHSVSFFFLNSVL